MSFSAPIPVAIIGAGPAGLMAAQRLLQAGIAVHLFEAMPTVARKFLYAGKSGMNITHAEATEQFLTRYQPQAPALLESLHAFNNVDVRQWVHDLGIETFVGSSQRVFPTGMKAAPLLRAWLHQLKNQGLVLHTRHYWTGWDANQQLCFDTPEGQICVEAQSTILALGGGSWAKLGSDARWVPLLTQRQIRLAALKPANCGFLYPWSQVFIEQFAGVPIKSIQISVTNAEGESQYKRGDLMVSQQGIEGGLIYGLSALIRDQILSHGQCTLMLDLSPDRSEAQLKEKLSQRKGKSITQQLNTLKLGGIKSALLRLLTDKHCFQDPAQLAYKIKHLPLVLTETTPISEAISTAGGVCFEVLDPYLMSTQHNGLFFAGEMLDWEAPTGGYLLTACLATGLRAGEGVLRYLQQK
ncbi:hypothetical protein SAMN02745127_02880 [Oceanospirillum multiglobuliferum]|uniref:NAD(FAD)-utilizing dehydrogenase n=1 Tax=Oceanospirillum multiglobuliferum TaxID=64969 RepID=A0A1T4SA49_9GAMM|nr:TIGR03862 family flavoprotein [Oceanospirillum multiglobuliferum]OPX54997.1 NAD(FAD)-utilizing dehydrogenase [Oceanospirillum multiglobuliferum]SKA25190.1 hypothetical protein SAMN02745127_02880 [Oceanospirillum multiglobuliferum]